MATSARNPRRACLLQHGRTVPHARWRWPEIGVAQRPLHVGRTQVPHSATSARRRHVTARTKHVRNTAAAAGWEVANVQRRLQSQRLPNTSATTARWSSGKCLAFCLWRWTQPRCLLHTATASTVPGRHGVLANERPWGLRRPVVLVPSATAAYRIVVAGAGCLRWRRTIPPRTGHTTSSATSACFTAGSCAAATAAAASSTKWRGRSRGATASTPAATSTAAVGRWTHLEAEAGC